MKKAYDKINCFDRYVGSPTVGKQILPFAALYDEPGRRILTDNDVTQYMTGALAHATRITVEETREHDDRLWCKVSARQGGNIQRGWCLEVFLEGLGKDTMGDALT